jgi:hypothetical protein
MLWFDAHTGRRRPRRVGRLMGEHLLAHLWIDSDI